MTTQDDILNTARAELGYTESPRGSNRNKFGAFFGMDRQPWCAFFVAWVYLRCGIDLRKYCDNVGYTPNLYGDLAALGWAVPLERARRGSLVFWKFTNRINHVGLFIRRRLRSVTTLDGNTGAGNDANGGAVEERTRDIGKMAGIIDVPMVGGFAQAKADNTLQALAFVIAAAKAHVLGPGRENPAAAVKILQSGLNRWADQFAAMAGAPNPPDLAVDGVWGQATADAVIAVQRLTGRNELGNCGAQTWATLYP